MAQSLSLSDLGGKGDEIARLCHESDAPVVITAAGKADLVLMTHDAYEQTQARLELYKLLDEAEEDVRQGDQGMTVAELRERLHL